MADILKNRQVGDEFFVIPSHNATPLPLKKEEAQSNPYQLEQEKEASFNQGFALGVEEGRLQALQEEREKNNALAALFISLPEAIHAHRITLSDEIANIVLVIAQQFFIEQQHNKNSILAQINQLLTHINSSETIDIALHPKAIAALGDTPLTLAPQAKLVADDKLQLGGCIITSEHGVFDASIERQIDNLKQMLLQIKQADDAL